MRPFSAHSTIRLSRATFEPKAGGSLPKKLLALLLVSLLVSGILAAVAAQTGYPGQMAAEQTNATLTRELERINTELAVERATRREVQRQADLLSGEVTRLTRQLEFLSSHAEITPKE